jgi:hypothetical protein
MGKTNLWYLKPKGEDSFWLQRGRRKGDTFEGTQIAQEIWFGTEREKQITERLLETINKIEEVAWNGTY